MIVIDFSGWCRINPDSVKFQYTGEDESKPATISGKEYLSLTHQERQFYILDNITSAIRDSDDLEWVQIDVSEEAE